MLTYHAKTPRFRALGIGNFPENGRKWESPESASADEADAGSQNTFGRSGGRHLRSIRALGNFSGSQKPLARPEHALISALRSSGNLHRRAEPVEV